MQTYLERAKLLKRISKRTDDTNMNNVNSNSSKPLNPINISNNEGVNYLEELQSLASDYITNKRNLEDLVNSLNDDNGQYPKEIVLNWDSVYKPIFDSFRGTNVNLRKIIDKLENTLNEQVHKKELFNVKEADNQLVSYFFDDFGLIKKDLQDDSDIIHRVLCHAFGLPITSSDGKLKSELSQIKDRNTIKNLDLYRQLLISSDKHQLISTFVETVLTHIDQQLLGIGSVNKIITDVNSEFTKESRKIFFESTIEGTSRTFDSMALFELFNKFNFAFINVMSSNNKIIDDFERLHDLQIVKTDANRVSLIDELGPLTDKRQRLIDIQNQQDSLKKEVLNQIDETHKNNKDVLHSKTDLLIMDYLVPKIDTCKNVTLNRLIEILKLHNLQEDPAYEYFQSNIEKLPESRNDKNALKKAKKEFRNLVKYTVEQKLLDYDGQGNSIIVEAMGDNHAKNQLDEVFDCLNVSQERKQKIYDFIKDNKEKHNASFGHGIKVGRGLKPHHHIINGKYYVDKNLLNNAGLLEVRYIKNGHLTNVKPNKVLSTDAKSIINNMFDGGSVNSDKFVKLSDFEKDLIRKINHSYLNDKHDLHDDNDDIFHKNYEILLGELHAGNNNHMIKRQLEAYINHAVDLGKLTHHQARKMITQLYLQK